jgi:drug/metabolite transporter (DMT)-like permease
MSRSQWLLLVALSVLWGGSFFFVGIAVKELPVFTIVLVRVALAAALLLPVVLYLGLRLPRTPGEWLPFTGMSILNNVLPFCFIVMGQKTVASGIASVLNATTPLFALLAAHIFSDEKLSTRKLAGVLLGVVGVAILIGFQRLDAGGATLAGVIFCLLGPLSYGLAGQWGRRLRGTPALVSATSQLMVSSLILGVLAIFIDQPWTLPLPSKQTVFALVGLAALSTSLAYVIFFRILAVSGPTNVMLTTLLIPITGIGLGVSVLGEVLEMRHIAGALVIGLGLLVIDGRMFVKPTLPKRKDG